MAGCPSAHPSVQIIVAIERLAGATKRVEVRRVLTTNYSQVLLRRGEAAFDANCIGNEGHQFLMINVGEVKLDFADRS